jgi:hypothetical protein
LRLKMPRAHIQSAPRRRHAPSRTVPPVLRSAHRAPPSTSHPPVAHPCSVVHAHLRSQSLPIRSGLARCEPDYGIYIYIYCDWMIPNLSLMQKLKLYPNGRKSSTSSEFSKAFSIRQADAEGRITA